MPNAGAELVMEVNGTTHRFLTFRQQQLTAALVEAGFQVREA
jgi:very-short-patch-repair endonuclease